MVLLLLLLLLLLWVHTGHWALGTGTGTGHEFVSLLNCTGDASDEKSREEMEFTLNCIR